MPKLQKKVNIIFPDGTKGDQYTVGQYVRINTDYPTQWRRVNSDGTLTNIGGFRPFNSNKENRRAVTFLAKKELDNEEVLPRTNLNNINIERYKNRQADLIGQYSLYDIPLENEDFTEKENFIISKGGINNRAVGAKVYTNVLDSIARNTGRFNRQSQRKIPIESSVGMASMESMFGGNGSFRMNAYYMGEQSRNHYQRGFLYDWTIPTPHFVSPVMLNSAWIAHNKNTINPDADAINHRLWNREPDLQYTDYLASKMPDTTTLNPYFEVYDLYLKGKSNPGQPNYNRIIYNEGKSLFDNSPEIQNWWNTSGKQEYNKGLNGN